MSPSDNHQKWRVPATNTNAESKIANAEMGLNLLTINAAATVYEARQMQSREKPEKPGFAVLMKGFPGTDPYKCILCGDRLRFAGAQAGIQQRNCCQKG